MIAMLPSVRSLAEFFPVCTACPLVMTGALGVLALHSPREHHR